MIPSVQEAPGRHLDGGSEFFQRGDLGVAFASLDPAHLGGMDAAAFSDLLLGQFKTRAGLSQLEPRLPTQGSSGLRTQSAIGNFTSLASLLSIPDY